MFVHVPAAWTAMLAYACLGGASFLSLVFRHAVADAAASAAAPLGAAFTFAALVTGSLWGKPMWGAWWVWGARLASVLVLFLLFLGYMALRASIDDEAKAARAGGDPGPGGADQPADHQVLRGLVEHPAPGRIDLPRRRADPRRRSTCCRWP